MRKKILIKFYQLYLLIIFLILFPILQLKYLLDKFLSYAIYFRKGNYFFRNYLISRPFTKSIQFQNTNIKILVNSFYDVWRTGGYKNFFLNDLYEDSNDEKIFYYDIGANTGFSSLIASKKLSNKIETFAIELEPANFKTLNDNILINNLKNITTINLGLSNQTKLTKFFYNKISTTEKNFFYPLSSVGLHSTKFSGELHSKDLFFNALMLKFDDLIEKFDLPQPTHLFIDAFGSEKDIMNGMTKTLDGKNIKKIYLDVEDDQDNIKNTWVYNFLIKKKFSMKLILEKKHLYAKNNWNVIFEKK